MISMIRCEKALWGTGREGTVGYRQRRQRELVVLPRLLTLKTIFKKVVNTIHLMCGTVVTRFKQQGASHLVSAELRNQKKSEEELWRQYQ